MISRPEAFGAACPVEYGVVVSARTAYFHSASNSSLRRGPFSAATTPYSGVEPRYVDYREPSLARALIGGPEAVHADRPRD